MHMEDPDFYQHIEVLPTKPSMEIADEEASPSDNAPLTIGFHPPGLHALQQLATLDTHCGPPNAPSDWPAAIAVAGDLLLREVMSRITLSKTTGLRVVLVSPLLDNVQVRDGDEGAEDEPQFITGMRASFQARASCVCTLSQGSAVGQHCEILIWASTGGYGKALPWCP